MSQSPFSSPGQNPYQSPAPAAAAVEPGSSGNGQLTPRLIELLVATRPWVRFLSILGYIIAVLAVLGGFAVSMVGLGGRGGGQAAMVGVSAIYVVMGVLYGAGAAMLGNYASRITDLSYARSTAALEEAIAAQRSFWRFTGIVMAVVVILYGGILLLALVFGLVGAFG